MKHEVIFREVYFFCQIYVYFTAHLGQNNQTYYIYSVSFLCTVVTPLERCEFFAISFLDAFRNLIQNLLEPSLTLEFKFQLLFCNVRRKLTSSVNALTNVLCTEPATICKIKYPYVTPRSTLNG